MLLRICLSFAVIFAVTAATTSNRKSYDGFKVYNVVPRDEATLAVLREMLQKDAQIDFWKEPSRVGHKVTFMVSPLHQQRVVTSLRRAGIEFTVHRDNVQDEVAAQWEEIDRRRAGPQPHVFDLNDFNSIEDINAWLPELAAQCREGFTCEVYSLGTSYEGRPINAFRMTKSDAGRIGFYLEATTHAREWITTSTIVNIMNALVTGSDENGLRLSDAYDWTLVPVVNVDGYSYTWTDDRLWRKNRQPVEGAACLGIDINRNYDWNWGQDGATDAPCSETFCGVSAASELETQAISAELQRLGSGLLAMMTLHAYGNLFEFPWGNTVNFDGRTCERAADHDELMRVAQQAATAIENTYNTVWTPGNSCEVMYPTSGTTDDYAKGAAGITYSFLVELRGDGFVIPAAEIPLAFQETWNGIAALCDAIESGP